MEARGGGLGGVQGEERELLRLEPALKAVVLWLCSQCRTACRALMLPNLPIQLQENCKMKAGAVRTNRTTCAPALPPAHLPCP